jgi:hypothetical protein
VIVTPEDPRQLEGLIEQMGVVNLVVTYVETADTPWVRASPPLLQPPERASIAACRRRRVLKSS